MHFAWKNKGETTKEDGGIDIVMNSVHRVTWLRRRPMFSFFFVLLCPDSGVTVGRHEREETILTGR